MYRYRRTAALMLILIMAFSILISPFSIVQASAPIIKPQFPDSPVLKQPGNIRSIKKEAPARAMGVSYKLKEGVEKLPSNIDYRLDQIKLEEFAAFDTAANVSGEQSLDVNSVTGIKYSPGSRFMVVPKSTASAFTPKVNKIYIDENEGTVYRMLQVGKTDAEGNNQYTVETPALTDIFESYTIPKQDIKLTTGNIAYMAPGIVLAPGSGMKGNYMAAAGDSGYISGYKYEGNKHILTLTENKIIFKYPSKEDEEKSKEEKEKAEKEKFKGDWWEKEQNSDLRGFEEEDELKVAIAIKEGTIVIEDPTFHADFDLNWLTTQVKADFYFESKTRADVTFVGDLSINKSMEACIFGYDIDLGTVLGKEKSNKAFVGIFLIIGANGKVHVEVRTTTTGDARAGYAYKAFGYGFIPYSVGPYVTYRPTSFDAAFTADGELHATLACVPQIGVIIWGTEIGALQIWLGFKADAEFSASGGGDSGGNASVSSKGSLDLSAFAEMVGYLFGKRYSIFYLDFPIYHGEWDVGTELTGGGGDLVRPAAPSFFVKADASTNVIEGRIVFDTDAKPFANRVFTIEIWNSGIMKTTLPGNTDGGGNFIINSGAYNLIPRDRVVVSIAEGEIYELENKKYKVAGRSKEIRPTVPYTSMDFNVDTFNDLITGNVSGKYNGPVDIMVTDWNYKVTNYRPNAVNGVFSLSAPINENTYNVKGEINFEGTKYPEEIVYRTPNLDALEINLYNEYKAEEADENAIKVERPHSNRITGLKSPEIENYTNLNEDDEGNKVLRPVKILGTITNKAEMGIIETHGDNYARNPGMNNFSASPYLGNVKITSVPITSAILDMINGKDRSNLTDPLVNIPGWTSSTRTQTAVFDGKPTSASTFEFIDPEVLAYTIEIEYEGLKKVERYNPFVFHYEKTLQSLEEFTRPVQKEVTLVTEDKKDAIVNPADNLNVWDASWITQIGNMELTQNGNIVSGKIVQGASTYTVEGIASNGVFRGSYIVPTESGFGEIVAFEMEISADGKSISFRNIDSNARLKGLNGSRAIKQIERMP